MADQAGQGQSVGTARSCTFSGGRPAPQPGCWMHHIAAPLSRRPVQSPLASTRMSCPRLTSLPAGPEALKNQSFGAATAFGSISPHQDSEPRREYLPGGSGEKGGKPRRIKIHTNISKISSCHIYVLNIFDLRLCIKQFQNFSVLRAPREH